MNFRVFLGISAMFWVSAASTYERSERTWTTLLAAILR
jgi:hypothetical protein